MNVGDAAGIAVLLKLSDRLGFAYDYESNIGVLLKPNGSFYDCFESLRQGNVARVHNDKLTV